MVVNATKAAVPLAQEMAALALATVAVVGGVADTCSRGTVVGCSSSNGSCDSDASDQL